MEMICPIPQGLAVGGYWEKAGLTCVLVDIRFTGGTIIASKATIAGPQGSHIPQSK